MSVRPSDRLAIAVAQLNSTVGDIAGNAEKVRRARVEAARQGADLVVFPELFIAGYPPEDLVLKPAFQAACRVRDRGARARDRGRRPRAAGRHALGEGRQTLQRGGAARWRRDHRAALQGRSAELRRVRRKARVRAGPDAGAGQFPWRAPRRCRSARTSGAPEVVECLAETGAEILLVPNGSPYWRAKGRCARQHRGGARHRSGLAAHLSSIRSADRTNWCSTARRSVCNADCSLGVRSWPRFGKRSSPRSGPRTARPGAATTGRRLPPVGSANAPIYSACVLGLRDYVDKNGFPGVVLGLSGGIDSALCAAMAVDALGAERVRCVMMPYSYTAQESLDDAAACAKALGVRYEMRADRAGGRRVRRRARTRIRRRAARRHRGKPAVARARHDPDGDLQQVRPDGGDHRQQVGNVGRLRHALWRHERRLQSDQGSLQDRGVPLCRGCAMAGNRKARSAPAGR